MSPFEAKAAPVDAALLQFQRRFLDRVGIGEVWSGGPDLTLTCWTLSIISMTFWLLVGLIASSASVYAQEPPNDSHSAALQLTLEFASDFARADPALRAETLGLIRKQHEIARKEIALAKARFAVATDLHYYRLVPARKAQAFEYLRALALSYARFKGAQTAGDRDWSARQLKAAQEYAALAADALIAEAQLNERDADRLRGSPFAMRRPPEQQAAFVKTLKANGLSPEHRNLLLAIGASEEEIKRFEQELLSTNSDQVGFSTVEWLSKIAASRREVVRELNIFAQANPAGVAGASAQTFVVGNPHDKQESVDLFIRPISVPPDWKLSVVNAGQDQANPQVAKVANAAQQFPVREVEAGKHYTVTLPSKAQVKVASVVIPIGELGANTTARWAVEGKIGNELIGGMVHEMNVPYVIADLQLPPVGSKEEEEQPAAKRAPFRLVTVLSAGLLILAVFVFFLIWRRRRAKVTP